MADNTSGDAKAKMNVPLCYRTEHISAIADQPACDIKYTVQNDHIYLEDGREIIDSILIKGHAGKVPVDAPNMKEKWYLDQIPNLPSFRSARFYNLNILGVPVCTFIPELPNTPIGSDSKPISLGPGASLDYVKSAWQQKDDVVTYNKTMLAFSKDFNELKSQYKVALQKLETIESRLKTDGEDIERAKTTFTKNKEDITKLHNELTKYVTLVVLEEKLKQDSAFVTDAIITEVTKIITNHATNESLAELRNEFNALQFSYDELITNYNSWIADADRTNYLIDKQKEMDLLAATQEKEIERLKEKSTSLNRKNTNLNEKLEAKTKPIKIIEKKVSSRELGFWRGAAIGLAYSAVEYISYAYQNIFAPLKQLDDVIENALPEPIKPISKLAYVVPAVICGVAAAVAARGKKEKAKAKVPTESVSALTSTTPTTPMTPEEIGIGETKMPEEATKPAMPGSPPSQNIPSQSVTESPIFCSTDIQGKICEDGSNTWLNFEGLDYYITDKGIFDSDGEPPTDERVLTLYTLHKFRQSQKKP